MKKVLRYGIGLLALSMVFWALPVHASGLSYGTIVTVSPAAMHGWAFRTTDGTGSAAPFGTAAFVTGPSTPPLGTGSVHLATATGMGDGSAQIRSSNYAGVPLRALTSLSYWTYMTANNGQQFPYIILDVSTTGGSVANDQLFFEPPYQTPSTGNPSLPNQGAPVLNTWQQWDALAGGWWNGNGDVGTPGVAGDAGPGVQPLSAYLARYPSATIVNTSAGGGVRMLVGYGSPTDAFDGNVDAFTIGVQNSGTLTYDFEPAPPQVGPPANKDQCKDGGWQQFNNPVFKNQGDCVSYVTTHGKNGGNG